VRALNSLQAGRTRARLRAAPWKLRSVGSSVGLAAGVLTFALVGAVGAPHRISLSGDMQAKIS
jgi:hypothetical protein